MPMKTIDQLRDMSEVELRGRAAEMRAEWTELRAQDRESDEFKAGKTEFLEQVQDVDMFLSLRAKESMPAALRSAPAGALGGGSEGLEYRSPGHQVVDDEGFRSWLTRNAHKSHLTNESPEIEIRALVDSTTTSAELLPVGQPYLANVRRQRLTVRDLITVMSTTLSAVPYVRELNVTTNNLGASSVAEGAAKPDQTFEFVPDLAPVQVIAAGVIISTQMFEDAQLVVQYINGSLVYRLKLREEKEILFGNGVSPDLKGVTTYSGVQSQAWTTSIVQTLGNAIGKVQLVDGEPTGCVLNPADYWTMSTNRASTSGVLDADAFTNSPTLFTWGRPTVLSNSVAAGTGYVADWPGLATLFDRSAASVKIFEQHAEVASHNQVYLRGEERVALAVARPDLLVSCDLTA